ncbi:hypothetical protein L208DRAFT_98325 [Tricholoma matsutake]|nr:hypothetical protein L208DRAFT_98325 [Tricholoma matsutake 945]
MMTRRDHVTVLILYLLLSPQDRFLLLTFSVVASTATSISCISQIMSANAEGQGVGVITQISQSGTTANSSESGHRSEPLSDALKLAPVEVEKGTMKRSGWWVKAPASAGHFSTDPWHSLHVALARSKPEQPVEESVIIKAPLGMRPVAGYQYQVLPLVAEDVSEKSHRQLDRSTVRQSAWQP